MVKDTRIHELFGQLIVFFNGVEKITTTIKEDIVKKGRDAIIIDREISGSIKAVAEKKINEIKKLYREKIDVINNLDIDRKTKSDIVNGLNNVILSLGVYNSAVQNVLNSEKHHVEKSYEEFKEKHDNYLSLNRSIIGHLGLYMHKNAA